MFRRAVFLAALGAALLVPPEGHAVAQSFTPGDTRNTGPQLDIVPLREIFATLKDRYGGYQLDAELFSTASGSEYRIDWMSGDGRRMRIVVNAQTGRILRTSGG